MGQETGGYKFVHISRFIGKLQIGHIVEISTTFHSASLEISMV